MSQSKVLVQLGNSGLIQMTVEEAESFVEILVAAIKRAKEEG